MSIATEVNPDSIILVSAGSRGHRLLFRYPFQEAQPSNEGEKYHVKGSKNPFSLSRKEVIQESGRVVKTLNYPNSLLANILSPQPSLCEAAFELKIGDVIFVGWPTLTLRESCDIKKEEEKHDLKEDVLMKMFHVVFVLPASTSQLVVNQYDVLSKLIAAALKHEENRCRYLGKERELMVAVQDEISSMPESCNESPFQTILSKSKLAQDLKTVYDSLCDSGIVQIFINNWINVSFCATHKIHRTVDGTPQLRPEYFESFLNRIRPYHSVLLLDGEESLLNMLPLDCSPALARLVKMSNPMKNFQLLSQDADVSLSQIFYLVSHLAYWGKAIIIYPLAESNVYVISHDTPTGMDSKIAETFKKAFPQRSLHNILSKFSFPTTLGEFNSPLNNVQQQKEQVKILIWLLKHRLLKQIHTYIYLFTPKEADRSSEVDEFIVDDLFDFDTMDKEVTNCLSSEEKKAIVKLQVKVDPDDIPFFLRLVRYFRGQHHLEEIMYYENIRRSELLAIIDKFRDILITTQHEDPAMITKRKADDECFNL